VPLIGVLSFAGLFRDVSRVTDTREPGVDLVGVLGGSVSFFLSSSSIVSVFSGLAGGWDDCFALSRDMVLLLPLDCLDLMSLESAGALVRLCAVPFILLSPGLSSEVLDLLPLGEVLPDL